MISDAQPAFSTEKKISVRIETYVALLALAAAVAAQFTVAAADHQNANIITAVGLAAAMIAVFVALHRKLRHRGRAIVPIMIVTLIGVLAVLFRHDGFSGEMVPLFKWRFASSANRPLQTLPVSESGGSSPETAIEDLSDKKPSDPDAQPKSTVAVQSDESSQFLGTHRNGVIERREFAVPISNDDVQVLWDIGIGSGWSSFAVRDGVAVTLEQRDANESLTAYDLSTGGLLWIQQHQGLHQNPLGGMGPRSTPTIVNDRVFANSATGHVWCVELKTGNEIWTADLLALAGWSQTEFETAAPWGHASSPLIVGDLCVLSLGGPESDSNERSLIALDINTGQPRWKSGRDQLSYASPMLLTLDGVRQIVSVNEKTVTGHRPDDGETLWTFSWPGSSNTSANCAAPIAVGPEKVLVGKGYGGGSALYRIKKSDNGQWNAKEVWSSSRVLKTKFNHACVDGNFAYSIGNGTLEAADLTNASRLWLQPRRSRAGQGHVLLVEDTLVVQHESGEVVFVEASPERYAEMGRISALTSKTWNIPTVAGRHLIVRNDRQAICFLLPERSPAP